MQKLSNRLVCPVICLLLFAVEASGTMEGEALSPGRLFITSDPPGGELIFDKEELGPLPLSVENIEPGPHDVRIALSGYSHWYQRMEIAPGLDYWIQAQLVKDTKYNRLDIESEPSGAQIYLDSRYRGNAPLTIFFIPEGTHHLVLRNDSLSWQDEIDIMAGDKESISAELRREPAPDLHTPEPFFVDNIVRVGEPPVVEGNVAWLNILSDPPDAELFLDDRFVGKAPHTVEDLPPGIHLVRLKKRGYADWFQRMAIAPGKNYRLTATLPQEAVQSRIEIGSSPDGAEVYLDGAYRGDTPLSMFYVPVGMHELSVLHDTLSWFEKVDIAPGDMVTIHATLIRQDAMVTVVSPLESLYVDVDGEPIGSAPCEFRLAAGKRRIRFWRGEDQESVRNLIVSSGQKIHIDVQELFDRSLFRSRESEYRSKKRRYLILGLASAAGSVGFHILKRSSYDQYMESTTLSDIEKNYDAAKRYQIISFSLAGASLYSFMRNIIGHEPSGESQENIVIRRE